MRDRRPEQRHEPVAEELVDRSLVAMHVGERHLKEAVDHQVKLLRPQLRRQRTGSHDVAKQHAHLLALTLDRAPHGQDLLADVPWRVTRRGWRRDNRPPAFGTEPGTWWQHRATGGTRNAQLGATMQAKTGSARILVPALMALHRRSPPAGQLRRCTGSALADAMRGSPCPPGHGSGRHPAPPTGSDQNIP